MPRTSYSEVHSKVLGVRMRATREQLGLTQAEVARRLRVQPPYIAAVEAGRVNLTIGQLATICSALGVGFDVTFAIPAREYERLPRALAR